MLKTGEEIHKAVKKQEDTRPLVYFNRLQLATDSCLKHSYRPRPKHRFYSSYTHGLSYCLTPKVACTHWINVFRFLANDTGGRVYKSPFDIPRVITHYALKKHMSYSEKISESMGSNLRFMFVREPYARLWSAYLDKLFLPDFWRTFASNIARFLKLKRRRCPTGITFRGFLDYIVASRPSILQEHWAPYRFICDVCTFRPHIIGKMETFMQDNEYILEKVGLSWIMDDITSHNHVEEELKMLTDYNFKFIEKKLISPSCLNNSHLSNRLWTTFQMNGYIRSTSVVNFRNNSYWSRETFKQEVLNHYRKDKPTPQEIKKIRAENLRQVYSGISNSVLIKLREIYKEDFEMFGYDPNLIPLNNEDESDLSLS
ncbi:hypothetical protein SNE40_022781 [Patella caerulea]|uniref:Carbohydrate sulfotransferase n=1 Tax=Patella caerulea TaxID=87958 RepID=A0AAN8G1H0_PATCE